MIKHIITSVCNNNNQIRKNIYKLGIITLEDNSFVILQ